MNMHLANNTIHLTTIAGLVSSLITDAREMSNLNPEARLKAERDSLKRWIGPYAENQPGRERALAYYAAARYIEARSLDEKERERPSENYLGVLRELQVRLARISDRCLDRDAPGVAAWLGLTSISRSWDDGRRPDLDAVLAERGFQAALIGTIVDELRDLRNAVTAAQTGNAKAFETMNEALAQIQANTEPDVKNAILFEEIRSLLGQIARNTSRNGVRAANQKALAKTEIVTEGGTPPANGDIH